MNPDQEPEIYALALMVWQYLEQEDGQLIHSFMSAGEHAIEVLANHGLVTEDGGVGLWTEKGLQFLDRQ